MDVKITQLKSDFHNITSIRTSVKNIFDILEIRINKLKNMYNEFIKTSKSKLSVFGLDSFHFQSKLIDIEFDDMKRLFLVINNRIYCEYFKLYKIIIEYILNNNTDKKINDVVKVNNYPIYKDLEPFKEYKFEIILDIHDNILNLLGILISTLNNKEKELELHKNKQKIGLNIDNFITTFSYNIIVMKEKLVMFITYIEFFHKLHTTYFKRFSNKIQLMYSHINNDIHFDEDIHNSNTNIDEINETITNETNINETNINETNINETIEIINNRSRSSSYMSSIDSSNISSITPNFKLKQIENSVSHDDLNNIFNQINLSCESIINNKINKNLDILSNIVENIQGETPLIIKENDNITINNDNNSEKSIQIIT
jgi:hypothetical protein